MENEAIHIVMEYAEQGDLYKVSQNEHVKENIDAERLKDQKEVFLWERLVGFRFSDMYGCWIPALEEHHPQRYKVPKHFLDWITSNQNWWSWCVQNSSICSHAIRHKSGHSSLFVTRNSQTIALWLQNWRMGNRLCTLSYGLAWTTFSRG